MTSSSDSKQNGNHACSSNNGTSKESTKESIKDIYRIFEFWNEQNIVQHRVFNKFQSAIKSCLEHFTVEEIIQAIRVYKKILDSSDHMKRVQPCRRSLHTTQRPLFFLPHFHNLQIENLKGFLSCEICLPKTPQNN